MQVFQVDKNKLTVPYCPLFLLMHVSDLDSRTHVVLLPGLQVDHVVRVVIVHVVAGVGGGRGVRRGRGGAAQRPLAARRV